MNVNLALTGALPGILAMWYVDRLDAKRPEPANTRRLAALLGALSVLPALALGAGLEATVGDRLGPSYTYEGALYTAFLRAAAVEELCKIGVIYWLIWGRPEFDERMDGIVYATRAGLGFAIVENFFYLLKEQAFDSFLTTWILRALLAVPGHAMWTGMIGAFGARRRFDGKGIGLIGGYLLAVMFHGAYDAFLFCNVPLTLEGREDIALVFFGGPVLLTIAAAMLMRRLSKTAAHLDDLDALRRGPPAGAPPQGGVAYGPPGPPGAYHYPYPYPPPGPQGGAWPPPSPYAPPGPAHAAPSPYAPPGTPTHAAPSPYAPPGAPGHAAPSPYAPPGAPGHAAPSPYAPPGYPPPAPSPYAAPGAVPASPSPYAPPYPPHAAQMPPHGGYPQPSPYAPHAAPPPGAYPPPHAAPPAAYPPPHAAPPGAYPPPHAAPPGAYPHPAPGAPRPPQPSPYAPPGAYAPPAGAPPVQGASPYARPAQGAAPPPAAPPSAGAPSPFAPPGRPPGDRGNSQ